MTLTSSPGSNGTIRHLTSHRETGHLYNYCGAPKIILRKWQLTSSWADSRAGPPSVPTAPPMNGCDACDPKSDSSFQNIFY